MDYFSHEDMWRWLYLIYISFTCVNKVSCEPGRRRPSPKFLPTSTNVTVHRGDLAVLRCRISNVGPKMVVWRKSAEDFPLTIGKESFSPEDGMDLNFSEVSETETNWDLLIKNVQPKHAGLYECQIVASNKITHYVKLSVINQPKMFKPALYISGKKYVDQYQKIRLICNATGSKRSPESVDWFFKGERIVPSQSKWRDRTQILKRQESHSFLSELIIERSSRQDHGNYVCRSSDLEASSITVHVLSAVTDNKGKRGSTDYSHSSSHNTGAKHSAIQRSTVLTLIIVISLLTSNR